MNQAPTNLLSLYKTYTGSNPTEVDAITGSASGRQYYRLSGPESLIGCVGNNLAENEAFLYLDKVFSEAGLNVPRVVKESTDKMIYLQEDLGDVNLYDIIRAEGFSERVITLCREVLVHLVDIQAIGAQKIDYSKCFPVAAMDRESISWDLNYFKYCFLKPTGLEIDEVKLEREFTTITEAIETCQPKSFILRDFQSRNIMVNDGRPYFIDFQGGRRGPALYDVVSFLWQARAGFPDGLRHELTAFYLDQLALRLDFDRTKAERDINYIVLFRMLQVLGAYGFRGLIEKKEQFIDSIPTAIKSALNALNSLPAPLPYISDVLTRVAQQFEPKHYETPSLRVLVTSFSYKKGLPVDNSGNGGGYVFDCRALHNPGRYDEYKPLTGNDEPVIRFLDAEPSVHRFLAECYALVDSSVEKYLERGFTDLMVSFGCTGGRHRSVYSANHMAQHIARKYGIPVTLVHREQDIVKHFNNPKP